MMEDRRIEKDLTSWHVETFLKSLGLLDVEGDHEFQLMIERLFDDVRAESNVGFVKRAAKYSRLRTNFTLSADGYDAYCVRATLGGYTTNFAYVYCPRGSNDPEFVCLGPPFYQSQVGEYRTLFIRYTNYLAAREKFLDELSVFEAAIIEKSDELKLDVFAYPGGAQGSIPGLERLPLELFTCSLANHAWAVHKPLIEVASRNYIRIVTALATPELVAASIKIRSTGGGLLRIWRTIGHEDLNVVQKMAPLRLREVVSPSDPTFRSWRETLVAQLASDLVLNVVTPSFPFYNNWMLVEGTDRDAYEAPALKEAYDRSDQVLEAAARVKAARCGLSSISRDPDIAAFDARMGRDIEYAQSFLIQSGHSLIHTSENVGWTLSILKDWISKGENRSMLRGSFATIDVIALRMFELVYALHVLHTRLGIAHCDIHSHNLTLYGDISMAFKFEAVHSLYVVGPRGNMDSYVFPMTGTYLCIVDYGDVVAGPSFGQFIPRANDMRAEAFYQDQAERALGVLERAAPMFGHGQELREAIRSRYDQVFPLICAADFIDAGRTMREVLDVLAPGVTSDYATRIEKHATAYLLAGLRSLGLPAEDVATTNGGSRKAQRPFPGEELIKDIFSSYRFDAKKAASQRILDVFNYNVPLRYGGRDVAKFPPWADPVEIERHLAGEQLGRLALKSIRGVREMRRANARIGVASAAARSEDATPC